MRTLLSIQVTYTCMCMLRTLAVPRRLLASPPFHELIIVWLRLVSLNARKWLFQRLLIEVSYKGGLVLYIAIFLPQSTGLKVVEVAHDMQLAVGRYVKDDLKLLNSFDTWHGAYQFIADVFCHHIVTTLHRNQECCQRACEDYEGPCKRSRCDLVY